MIFNFLNKIFRRTHFGESVTERKLPVQLWNFHQGSYTPQEHHPSDRIFGQIPKYDFFCFLLYFSLYMFKPSSVTKRNIMEGTGKVMGMVFTPHQCWYSDRKSLYWEKKPTSAFRCLGASITIPNTLPWWFYQYWTLWTTLGPFKDLPGAKNAVLALFSPFARGRTVLHILNWLKNCPKVENAQN